MKFIRFNLFLIILYINCSLDLFSQTPPFYHYTSSEGLASSQVYDMIQDRNGFMWFATANGVSQFDGNEFVNFTTKDGLNSNSIICLTEGNNGEIYFGNETEGFNVFDVGKMEKYSYSTERNPVIIDVITDADKLYSYYANNISIVNKENTVNLLKNLNYPESMHINKIAKVNEKTLLAATSKGIYKFEDQELKEIKITGLEEQEFFWLCVDNEKNILLGAKGKIYEVKDNALVRTINVDLFEKNNVFRLLKDTKGNIWFSIMNKGFYFIKAGTNGIEDLGKKMKMEKSLVNNFLEDNEGNIWVSTYGEGVFCLNNLYLNNYSQKDGLSNDKVLAIEKDHSDRLFVGTLDGLNVLDNGNFFEIKNLTASVLDYTYIYEIKCMNDSVYIAGTFDSSNLLYRSNYKNYKLFQFLATSFCVTQKNEFIKASWNNDIFIQQYPPKKIQGEVKYLIGDSGTANKVFSIFNDERDNLWEGTTLGLCKITHDQKSYFTDNEILSSKIKYIIQDRNNKVWFAGDKGVASYDLNDSVVMSYPKIGEHDMVSSNTLSVDNYNRIWIGSMNGLFILDKDSIKALNTETGLPSNEILSLYYDNAENNMWVGSAKGLSSLDINALDVQNTLPVKVQIRIVRSEDSVYADFNNISFNPDVKNIFMEFSAVNLSSPGSVKYQYMIQDEWIDIPDDNINLISLEMGDYNLAIRAKAINTSWGEPKLVSFTVLPFFTETFYFRSSVAVLIFFGIVFAASKRIKFIKVREKEKLEISNQVNDLKHKALSSMMNPHFIFNSLNSVQYLVNSDRKREANDYIALMAKLIRMNLDTASESYIRLEDEIQRLDLYLQIEKLRFSEKFDYKITTGSKIDPVAIMIPNMIIQPFVENSIWHGIMPSSRNGFIKLSFNFEDVTVDNKTYKFFTIRIIDNGIGLTQAQKNKKDGHISKGIQIIQERLILLSKESKLPRPIFEDLNSNNKDTQGTEVVLSIPPELYKIISN